MNKIYRTVTVTGGKSYWVVVEGVNSADQGASATVNMYLLDDADQVELTVDDQNAFEFIPDTAAIAGAITEVVLDLPNVTTINDLITDGTTHVPANLVVYVRYISPTELVMGTLDMDRGLDDKSTSDKA